MRQKTLKWLLFAVLSLTWGSSFILMKRSMFPAGDTTAVLGPFQVGALRILLAGVVMLPVSLHFRTLLNRQSVGLLLITGFFGNLMPAMLFTLAETAIASSLAGLVNTTTSLFVVCIGFLFYRSRPSLLQITGVVLGSVGLYFVLMHGSSDAGDYGDVRYALFLFPATLGYAISLTTIKFKLRDIPPAAIASLSFLLMLPAALVACLATGAFSAVFYQQNGLQAMGYVSLLAIVGTAMAALVFNRLIVLSHPVFASAISYVIPVVAGILGVLDGEHFQLVNLIWIALILGGVVLMNRPGAPRKMDSKK